MTSQILIEAWESDLRTLVVLRTSVVLQCLALLPSEVQIHTTRSTHRRLLFSFLSPPSFSMLPSSPFSQLLWRWDSGHCDSLAWVVDVCQLLLTALLSHFTFSPFTL